MKMCMTIKDDVVIIHKMGEPDNIYFECPLQEYEYNGNKRKCIDISVFEYLQDEQMEVKVY